MNHKDKLRHALECFENAELDLAKAAEYLKASTERLEVARKEAARVLHNNGSKEVIKGRRMYSLNDGALEFKAVDVEVL